MSDDQGDADFEASLAGLAEGRQREAMSPTGDGGAPALDGLHQTLGELADRLSGLEQGLDDARSELAVVQRRLGAGTSSVVQELQDNLSDVASGEVVSALWEEVRAVRDALPDDAGAADAEVRSSLEALRAEVEGIAGALATTTDDRLGPLSEELASLRTSLAEGLVVEPSEELSSALEGLRAEVDTVRDALAAGAVGEAPGPAPELVGPDTTVLEEGMASLRAAVEQVQARLDEGLELSGPDTAGIEDTLASLRAGLNQVQARLDEGLELAGGLELPGPAEDPRIDELAAQLTSMRELMSTELDALREAVTAPSAPMPEPVPAGIDEETVELLREEIRAAGTVSDQLIEALRDELKALRRRIAVKASEKVLDDQQLAQIADAVAARLAEG